MNIGAITTPSSTWSLPKVEQPQGQTAESQETGPENDHDADDGGVNASQTVLSSGSNPYIGSLLNIRA